MTDSYLTRDHQFVNAGHVVWFLDSDGEPKEATITGAVSCNGNHWVSLAANGENDIREILAENVYAERAEIGKWN